MGARLMSLVLVRWTHLSGRAFRVLSRMASTALDEASPNVPAATYFGGHDLLALTLRNSRGGKPESVLRSVRFALDELIEEGAIERIKNAHAGQNAVYRLTLNGERRIDSLPRDPGGMEEPSVPPMEELHVPPMEEPSVPEWRNSAALPRNQEEPVEDLEAEDQSTDLRTAVTVAREESSKSAPNSHLSLVVDNTRKGTGFCQPCYEKGQFVLAADPANGWACAMHLRQEAS